MFRSVITLCLCALSVLFGYLYYVQYYQWRDCFNDMGRCFDPNSGVVYMEHSGVTWLTLALLSMGAAALSVRFLRTSK